ncbi:MAG: NUDIX domain-containing protein [Candidatus Paceibacterota bacterium]
MADIKLEELLAQRDKAEFGSEEWERLNIEKADYLESIKPSTRERIVFFEEKDLGNISGVFTKETQIFDLPFGVGRRSLLEYHPTRRHPIPYVLIRYEDEYFFILRESGGGELRLIGKKGLIGGHVDDTDITEGDLERTFQNALLREAKEEAGLDEGIIECVELRGIIKSDLGVDIDHLGLVYEIVVNTNKIKSEEDGVMTGVWITKEDLPEHYESFENWSKIVYDNLLKNC